MKDKILYPLEYFLRSEVGIYRVDLECWLEFLYKARDLKEHQLGGNLISVFVEDGVVYISYYYEGGTEILPLERLISLIEPRLPGKEHELG